MGPLELAKKAAAHKAIDEYVKNGNVIGIGSGSTIVHAVSRLVKLVDEEKLNIVCVPTSFQARELIVNHKLQLGSLDQYPKLDCVIDGADEVDAEMNLIKGGGGCLLQEKIIASCTDQFIVIADYTKKSEKLGDQYKRGLPIEVIPMAYVPIRCKIDKKYGGNVELRMAKSKAGPIITDNGNFILDWHFPDDIVDWQKINTEISLIPGVVETGLFIKMANKAFFGMPDGTVTVQTLIGT